MSRDLIYRVSIQTSSAKREARNIRSTFENELRTITLGKLDASSLKTGVADAQKLRAEIERATVAMHQMGQASSGVSVPSAGGGIGGFFSGQASDALNQIKGLVTGYLGLQGVIAGVNEAIDLTRLNTQAQRANKSFDILSGGAEKAAVNVATIQTAAGGAVTSLDAIAIGNQAASLGLAKTAQGFEDLARAARIITQVSPIIKDQGEALTQLALFSSNAASYARADQLGLSATEVRARIKELREENGNLDDSQLKLLASTQLLDEKFGSLLNTTEAQASGFEKLTANYEEFRIALAGGTGPIDAVARGLASGFSQATTYIAGTDTPLTTLLNNLKETERQSRAISQLNPLKDLLPDSVLGIGVDSDAIAKDIAVGIAKGIDQLPGGSLIPDSLIGLDTGTILGDPDNIKQVATALEVAANAVAAGVPGAEDYFNAVSAIAVEVDKQNFATSEQVALVGKLTAAYQSAAQSGGEAVAEQRAQAEAAKKAEEARLASVYDQQAAIEQALAARATKAAPVAGVEEVIKTYRDQKLAAERAIDELAATGISDAGEIAINVADITQQLLQPFDELEARASEFDLMSALGNFTDVGTALSGLNAGFVDFLPGLSAARDELITLSNEMALTGQLSDEQAARLEYLSAVAYSVADGGSALNAVVAELGGSFLESNAYAAELVNQLFLAEAAYAQGAITGDIYAGIMATLTGQLLTVAQGAGIATGAIMQLNAAQSGMASIGGLAIGGSIANRIQTQQQAAGREQNRREQERYNRDLERSQERSASRAGKLLEDGAKKANQELKSALDKVPGLFSTTQVTEQDMKDTELGIYRDKVDEYARQFEDEVKNGKDWANVSLEEVRAGLVRAGLEAGDTAEQTLEYFKRAINDSSLFSAAENIPIFINEEAVKYAQELQNKSEEGRKNIYEYFGVVVEDATTAATGGGGGAAIEVKPPEFVDIDPLTEGLQTGLDEYVATTGAVIKEQVATAKALFFDPANLFGATGGKAGAMGPAAKPEITVTADPAATALMPVITGQVKPTVNVQFAGAQAGAQAATMTITPTLDLTGIQAQLDALTAPTLDVKLSLNAENIISINGLIGALTPTISPLLNASAEAMSTFAATLEANMPTVGVETNLTASVGTMSEFTVYLQDNIPTPGIEVNLTTTVGAMSDFTVYLQDNVPTPGIQTALAVTVEEIQLFEKLVSGLVHPTVTVDLAAPQQQTNEDGSQGANAITPLITGINTQIRGSQEEIKNQGITIAMILMAGIAAHFQGGQTTGGEQASTPLADALMTNVSTQFSAAQGMFYAVGFLPAQSVESGFKGYGYTGLSSGLLDALTTGIRADADSYMQRGATIAGYVQAGMNQQFSAETGVRAAIAAGAAWGNAFMQGVFEALNGAGFVDQISTQVIDGITGELEQP